MTGRPVVLLGSVLALVLAGGCAYYNGLYNANRLADEARRAEREGRVGEARSLWSQAATKAESVAVKFPDSKWRDDALLLQGHALLRIDACTRAVVPLEVAADSSADPQVRAQARIALARCRLFMREPAAAAAALGPLIAGRDSTARDEALYWRGRAYLELDRPRDALADLDRSTDPQAAFPRAIALARLGRAATAGEVLASRLRGPYDEAAWLPALDSVGRADAATASALAQELARRSDLTGGQRIRLLVADGERWMLAGDTATAGRRFTDAMRIAPDSSDTRIAQAWLAVHRVRETRDPSTVTPLLEEFRAASQQGGRPLQISARYVTVLTRAAAVLDAPDPDPLAIFVTAEQVRDSLGAVPLAAELFYGIAREYPESVLAPKALLAAAQLEPARADSLLRVLRTRYAESVYTRALDGEAGARYEAVEDSLRAAYAARGGRVP